MTTVETLPELAALYQVMPALGQWDRDQLKESIAETLRDFGRPFWPGHEPVIDEDGRLLDGHHRLAICGELGVVPTFQRITGWTADQKVKFAYQVNTARRQLTIEQRRDLRREYLKRFPAATVREVAAATGLSRSAAGRLSSLSHAGQERQTRDVDVLRDGETRDLELLGRVVERDEERSPLQHSDHRKEWWVEVVVGAALPPGEEQIHKRWDRTLQAYVPYPREGERVEWSTGRMVLPGVDHVTNQEHLVDLARQIGRRFVRRALEHEDRLPTLETR